MRFSWPLLNQASATAAALVGRGAVLDIHHAAALGRLDLLERFLAGAVDARAREDALAFACIRGQVEAARLLARSGVRGDVLVTPGGRSPCTALHEAAN